MSEAPRIDDLRIHRPTTAVAGRPVWPWVLVAALLAAATAVYWWLGRPRPVPVTTALARAISATEGDRTVLNASGYVVARREATVSSKVMGKVTEVLVEEGVKVAADQVLARLDATNLQASLRLAETQTRAATAAIQETRVRLREAELELGRQTALRENRVNAPSDFDRAEAAVLALRARIAQQETELAVAEQNSVVWRQQVDDTIIRAPFAGVVTSKNAQPGEMISPLSSGGFTRTGICTVVDMESLEIEIDVNESYLNRVTPGQEVTATLDAYPAWAIPCRVIAIIPTADRQKSTVRVRVGFAQLDPRILPQMSVKVAFRDAGSSASTGAATAAVARTVIVPKSAVVTQDGRDVIFVVQAGRAERRAVTVAAARGGDVTLAAGITAGERVIAPPPAGLADGAAIVEKQP